MLRIEISTDALGDDEVHVHDLHDTDDKKMTTALVEAVIAIETLYGHDGVRSIYIYTVEE